MTVYKLLNRAMESHNECKWKLGEWEESEYVGEFCAPGGFHAYEDPLLAVLHNPVHAQIESPRLFVAEAEGEIIRDGQMKLKAQRMRVVEEIPVPSVTTSQRAAYAILCAKAVCSDKEWNRWADGWLSGNDRSEAAAGKTGTEVAAGAEVVTWRRGAGAAIWAAMWAARESVRESVGESVGAVAWASVQAAAWAARAAEWATARAAELDLVECAKRALKEA